MTDRTESVIVHRKVDPDGENPAVQISEAILDFEDGDSTDLLRRYGCVDGMLNELCFKPPIPEAQTGGSIVIHTSNISTSQTLVFSQGTLERAIRIVLIVSGILSLAGLVGVPLSDMQVRNIGIVGYAIVSPVAFLLIGVLFGRTRTGSDTSEQSGDTRTSR